ncbi:fimbrial protein (plasmid) [Providencia rettgeri]|uniref:fimbrial protein n=1 Tax=Providencia rettgeri TaxID=587 RepID=UPI001CA73C77|nr:fimbrial protein [Providencia rettgeri]QZY66512.1 fimbrial protein [Providencia rettgeri]
MRKNIIVLFIYFTYFSAFAVDVTVNVNGGILAQSCNVISEDLVKNINFPDLNPGDFNQVGMTSSAQAISIHLDNCSSKVNNMSYKFSGEPDSNDTSLLKILGKVNSSAENVATGLAIEILDKDQKKISLNAIYFLNKTITTPRYDLSFYLRYRSTQKEIGSGDASSLLFLDIYYE